MPKGMTDREKMAYYMNKYGKGLSAKRKKEKKDTLMMKTKRKVKELIGGKNTYLKKKKFTSVRTKGISEQAGSNLTPAQIAKLRDKGKSK